MSHLALQHVIVRMLYDPPFVDRVYADPGHATADCDLTDDERAWLVRADRRAWSIDRYRRARSLAGLIEEYAVTCARIVRAHGRDAATARLDGYFSSDAFHHDLQAGDVLAASFGGWLAAQDDLDLPELPIEAAIARARQAHAVDAATPAAGEIVCAPGVEVAFARDGAVASFAAALGAIRVHPDGLHAAVLDRNLDLGVPPAASDDTGVLVLGHTGDVGLESASLDLARIVAWCSAPIGFEALCARATELDATADDVRGLVDAFAADGILVVVGR